jgi:hypothetical protein
LFRPNRNDSEIPPTDCVGIDRHPGRLEIPWIGYREQGRKAEIAGRRQPVS